MDGFGFWMCIAIIVIVSQSERIAAAINTINF